MSLSCFSWCQSTEENAVREIDLSNSALHDVPHSIFLHERTLDTLFLNSNRIQDLPLPLFYCQNLQFLNLSDNEIASLPAAIGSLVHLRTLDLNRNCVEEVNECIKGCRKLSVLNLSMNPLRQFPEPVTQLISLEELYLNDTSLDYLPANVGRLVHLRILELRDNKLSSLPKAVARFSRLLRLDIGQNDFTYLPEVVGELHELQELWLDLNGMLEVPLFLGNLKRLSHLDISENRLEEVPQEVGECRLLTELSLSSNDLRSLPSMIGGITNLVTLKLDLNDLSSLPMSIGELFNLEELYVASNKLETLPSSIGLLRKLVSLGLDSNQLQYLPPEIGSCTSLRVLTVQNNLLRNIPAEIGNLQNLTVLSLTNNQLKNLPMSVLKLSSLKALWLVYNQSKPLTPLVKDWDPHTGSMVLTCYLLPQTHSLSDSSYNVEDDVNAINYKQKPNEKPKIRFSINPVLERQSVLFRAPTPYPKKLRELAKCARAIASQCNYAIPEQNGELSVVNVSGTNVLVDQVRTAIVKKHTPSMVNGNCLNGQMPKETETPVQRLQQPPPYHIAAAFSKQAPFFQKETYIHKEERRTDIDTEALSTLKDELLHHLPPNECQLSQSEQSGSVELIYPVTTAQCHDHETQNDTAGCRLNSLPLTYSVAMSDVDSAFVDNIDSTYRTVEPHRSEIVNKVTTPSQNGNDGTYSAYPGIITIDNSSEEALPFDSNDCLPFDSSSYPISKVNNWLCSKIKGPVTESGCELINMYPCENSDIYNSDNNQNIQASSSSVAIIGKKQEELITSSKITKPSKLPWLFGVHKNPKVVEVTVNKSETELGFDIAVINSGVYVKSVSNTLAANGGLREGDKILQVEDQSSLASILSTLNNAVGSFSMMISRQT